MSLFKRKKDKKKPPTGKDKSFDELSQMVDKKEQVEKPAKVSDEKTAITEDTEKSTEDTEDKSQSPQGDSESSVIARKALKKEKKKKDKKEEIKKEHGQAYKHLIRPVITEKASSLGMYNQYVFEIAPKANKIEVKKAIEKLYGVKPVKINIINMRGKNVRYGRQMGKLKNWKKAVVTLRSGDKIDVYEGV